MNTNTLAQKALERFLEDLDLARYEKNLTLITKASKSKIAAKKLMQSLELQKDEPIIAKIDSTVAAEDGTARRVKGNVGIDRQAFFDCVLPSFDATAKGVTLAFEFTPADVVIAGSKGELPARVNGGERMLKGSDAAKLLRLVKLSRLSDEMASDNRDAATRAKLDYLKKSLAIETEDLLLKMFPELEGLNNAPAESAPSRGRKQSKKIAGAKSEPIEREPKENEAEGSEPNESEQKENKRNESEQEEPQVADPGSDEGQKSEEAPVRAYSKKPRKRSKALLAALKKIPAREREPIGICQDWIDSNGRGVLVKLKGSGAEAIFAVQIDDRIFSPITGSDISFSISEKQYFKFDGKSFIKSAPIKLLVPPKLPKGGATSSASSASSSLPASRNVMGPASDSVPLSDDKQALIEQTYKQEFGELTRLGEAEQKLARDVFLRTLDIDSYEANSAKILKAIREAKDALGAALLRTKTAEPSERGERRVKQIYSEVKSRIASVFGSLSRELERQEEAPISLSFENKRKDEDGERHHEKADATLDQQVFADTDAHRVTMVLDGEEKAIDISSDSLSQTASSPFVTVLINAEPMRIKSEDAITLVRLNKFLKMFDTKIEELESSRSPKERINEAVRVREGVYKRLATLMESLEAIPSQPAPVSSEKPAPAVVDYQSSLLFQATKAKNLEEAISLLAGTRVRFKNDSGVDEEGVLVGTKEGRVIVEVGRMEKVFSFFSRPVRAHLYITLDRLLQVNPSEGVYIKQISDNVDDAWKRVRSNRLTAAHQLEVAHSVVELVATHPEILIKIVNAARSARLSVSINETEKAAALSLTLEQYIQSNDIDKLSILKQGVDHLL